MNQENPKAAVTPSALPVRVVVGLGNPGARYEGTRHNVGFMALDRFALMQRVSWQLRPKWESAVAKLPDREVLLVKPQCFMNLSGRPLAKILREQGWKPSQLLVLHDDVALDMGRVRMREKGSHGGHNGIRSMIECLGTDEFARLKLGVGAPGEEILSDYVLARFSLDQQESLQNMLAMAVDAVQDALSRGVTNAATHVNTLSNSTFKKPNEQKI